MCRALTNIPKLNTISVCSYAEEIVKRNIDELKNLITEHGGVLSTVEANSFDIAFNSQTKGFHH
jgi:hypothetical protein